MSTATAEAAVTANDETKHPRPRPVLVLDHGEEQVTAKEWTKHLSLHRDSILTLSAYAKGNFNNPQKPGNAGITVRIFVGRRLVAADMCFEGTSSTIDFHAAASHSIFLKAGSHKLLVKREDNHLTTPGKMEICYHVVAAETKKPH